MFREKASCEKADRIRLREWPDLVNSGGGGYPQGAQAMMAGMMDPNSLMANPMVKDMAM